MKRVGYMPEVPIAYEDMAIFEFLIYMGRLLRMKKEDTMEQARELMQYTGYLIISGLLALPGAVIYLEGRLE